MKDSKYSGENKAAKETHGVEYRKTEHVLIFRNQ